MPGMLFLPWLPGWSVATRCPVACLPGRLPGYFLWADVRGPSVFGYWRIVGGRWQSFCFWCLSPQRPFAAQTADEDEDEDYR